MPHNDLSGIIGKHLIYTYDNGWQYEYYIKNEHTADYRIHSGIVGGRWVKQQDVYIVAVADDVYKISWDEPTGTLVSLTVNLAAHQLHGFVVFPRWVELAPEKTIGYQNEQLELMQQYRDAGPTYPKYIIDEFATITFIEDSGPDREDVIDCHPRELPAGYASRRNV